VQLLSLWAAQDLSEFRSHFDRSPALLALGLGKAVHRVIRASDEEHPALQVEVPPLQGKKLSLPNSRKDCCGIADERKIQRRPGA